MKKITGFFLMLFFAFAAGALYPQADGDAPDALIEDDAVRLPDVEVSEQKETAEYVTQERMERENSADLWEALRNIPGIVRDGGGGMRNESNFTIRGMDEKLVPVFIDGALMSSPYRGDTDYARFLSADLEDIEIHKGYSSMLLGSNTFGGAVIMRTAKPKKPFEALLKTGIDIDSVGKLASETNVLSVGSEQDTFYGKTVLQYRNVDHYRLSAKFKPYQGNPQGNGDRLFSDSSDLKLSLLAGWTPNAPFELNAVYVLQDADKGVSPQETAGLLGNPRYDVWLDWSRQSITLDALYKPERFYIKGLFAFNKFDNTLSERNTLEEIETHDYYQPSVYDDYGFSANLEAGYDINSWNNVKGALIFKQEGHKNMKDLAEGGRSSTINIKENTFSAASEYGVNILKPLTFNAGIGFDMFIPAYFWNINDDMKQSEGMNMFSAQTGFFFDVTENHELHLTFAKKNHVPTMTMRYSSTTSVGTVNPNPNLKPEEAYHFEAGYKGNIRFTGSRVFQPSLDITAAAYYSSLQNMLAEKTNSTGQIERINANKTAYYGFETGISAVLNSFLSMGGDFALNKYKVEYSEEGTTAAGNYPSSTFSVYFIVNPFVRFSAKTLSTLSLIPSVEYEGSRYGSKRMVNVNAANKLPAYALFNCRVSSDITDFFTAAAGIENILDANYALENGALPLAGRTFYFTLTAKY